MPVAPPDHRPTPKWAQALVNAANSRNRARSPENPQPYYLDDLIAAWKSCDGRCDISGLEFDLQVVGDGQARRPFAPSLDRVDRHKPYQRDNVRLVVSVANFAMNAWGEEPLRQLASAICERPMFAVALEAKGPVDDDLSDSAKTDAEVIETPAGRFRFPPREDMCEAVLDFLKDGPEWSSEIEEELARRFHIEPEAKKACAGRKYSPWRYRVSFALVALGTNNRGTAQIERVETRPRPSGGTMGLYRLR